LQISDQGIFGADLMVEFKVVNDFLFGVTPHLFIVMFVLIEDPLEIGDALSKLDFLPYLPLIHDGPDEVLIVIAVDDSEGELLRFGNFIDL
jgi:hypothetical protein